MSFDAVRAGPIERPVNVLMIRTFLRLSEFMESNPTGPTMVELARLCGFSTQSASRLLRQLEKAGWIERPIVATRPASGRFYLRRTRTQAIEALERLATRPRK